MTTISVFGGLSTSLKILMGIILLALKKFQGQLSQRAIQTWFMGFNDRRRLSTRLNTLLIGMAIIDLYLSYAFRKYQQVNEIARDPSLELYLNFVHQYPSGSLYCPCSQASIPYNSFYQYFSNQVPSDMLKKFLDLPMAIYTFTKTFGIGRRSHPIIRCYS